MFNDCESPIYGCYTVVGTSMAEVETLQKEILETNASIAAGDESSYGSDSRPATRREVWAYYAYFAGNNGIGSYQ